MNSAYNQANYDQAVDAMKEIAAGKRGWISLTEHSRKCGVPKSQLAVVAKAIGLSVTNHGNFGMTARKK